VNIPVEFEYRPNRWQLGLWHALRLWSCGLQSSFSKSRLICLNLAAHRGRRMHSPGHRRFLSDGGDDSTSHASAGFGRSHGRHFTDISLQPRNRNRARHGVTLNWFDDFRSSSNHPRFPPSDIESFGFDSGFRAFISAKNALENSSTTTSCSRPMGRSWPRGRTNSGASTPGFQEYAGRVSQGKGTCRGNLCG